MMQKKWPKWLPALLPVAILTLLFGCSGSTTLRQAEAPETEAPSPYMDRMQPEQQLEAMPRWMARADNAWARGDSVKAEELMVRSILALQGILLDVPQSARMSMADTLLSWSGLYEERFGTLPGDMVATDEGLSEIFAHEQDVIGADSLLGTFGGDTATVELDTTILEVDALPAIPDTFNAKVERMIQYFTQNPRGRVAMTKWLERAGEMIPRMRPILRQHGMPEDLVYLSMIESGFRQDARSWARAVGPWQFIYSTGRLFDLEADWWYDQRRDPEMATHAASRFLRQLHEHLGHWYLALSAYNCGEGRVWREIRRSNSRDFWHLNRLPRQTRNYVPTFLAARKIAENPEEYGFEPIRFSRTPPRDTVLIREPVELQALAEALDVDLKQLHRMNPSLLRWCTPPNREATEVYLPEGFAKGFDEVLAAIPQEKKTSWARHKVRSGETLSTIASRYRTSVRAIMDVPANGLRNPNRIRVGTWLLIPVAPSSDANLKNLYALDDPEMPSGTRRTTHTVRRGDTLSEIAVRYHVGLSRLLRWNGLSRRSLIRPGQRLVVYQTPNQWRRSQADQAVATASTRAALAADGPSISYRVRYGDSLWDIAKTFGVRFEDLLAANGLTQRSMIHPGQMLRVPTGSSDAVFYPVQPGDTLWDIASRFDVSVAQLKNWNNIGDARELKPGDRLIVRPPGGAKG